MTLPDTAVGPLPDELLTELRRQIESRSGRQIDGLSVGVTPCGGLVLRGRARSYFAKQMAQHTAARLTGRIVIANRIEVV
jgi:hypothetical protein